MTWSRRRRDWAKAQRTIHNLKAQEASLVEQLRHANAEAERLEAERASWERTSRHYETLANNAGLL